MAKQPLLWSAFVYGLLITTVLGRESDSGTDSCTLIAIGAGIVLGVGSVIVVPALLTATGFTAAGVAAGSIAAAIQTPLTVGGGLFATAQSVGAAGLGVGATAAMGTIGGLLGYKGYKTVSGCEEPNCE